jgi:hypothetical protein
LTGEGALDDVWTPETGGTDGADDDESPWISAAAVPSPMACVLIEAAI